MTAGFSQPLQLEQQVLSTLVNQELHSRLVQMVAIPMNGQFNAINS